MAQALKIQIALAGAAEVKAQLEGIGEAGQQAFNSIAKEANKIGSFNNLDPTIITKKIEQFGVKGKDAIDKINNAVKTAGRFESLVSGLDLVERALMRAGIAGRGLLLVLGPIGAAATILAVIFGAALVGALIKTAQSISSVEREAIKLGASFEELSKVRIGLSQLGVPFAAISDGLKKLQGDIDKLKLEAIEQAFAKAQKNIAAGWGPGAEQLRVLETAAQGAGEAGKRARAILEELGRPIQDNVTPLLDAIVRSAGGAAQAIPTIAAEMEGLRTSGEKARFMEEFFNRLKVEAGGAVPALRDVIKAMEQMPASAARDKAVIDALGESLGTRLVQVMRSLPEGTKPSIDQVIEQVKTIPAATVDASRDIDLTINKIKTGLATMFENVPVEKITTAVTTFGNAAQGAFQLGTTSVNQMNSAMDGLIGKINQAAGAMSRLQGAGAAAGAGAGAEGGGFAGGGFVGGRGSGTSDSNLAWVSRGEHIMPARAVRQPGMMALLEALRRSGGNMRGVFDRMGHFASGGVVGAAGGMSNVTIAFPGMPAIGGLRASSAVVDELRRAAAMAQVRSGGRKPSRYS